MTFHTAFFYVPLKGHRIPMSLAAMIFIRCMLLPLYNKLTKGRRRGGKMIESAVVWEARERELGWHPHRIWRRSLNEVSVYCYREDMLRSPWAERFLNLYPTSKEAELLKSKETGKENSVRLRSSFASECHELKEGFILVP